MKTGNRFSARGKRIASRLTPFACSSLLLLFLCACGGPFGVIPGGALSGEERGVDATSFPPPKFDGEAGVIQLETRPTDPYSINVTARLIDGNLFVDPSEARTWYQHMKADPRVRLRFPGTSVVYLVEAVEETDATVLDQFAADRRVLRLDPRER